MLATANRAKAREMAALLSGIPFRILNLADCPGVTLPPEGESSYAENALAKARAVAFATGEMSLADDSGIEVDALGGGPGVLSARYGGLGLSDPERCELMLREMAAVPRERRTARFRCLIAIVCPRRRREMTFEGVVEGALLEAPRGDGGFGYDPLFFYPPLGRGFAELAADEKNRVSHRAQACQQARAWLLSEP
ncbi:MAG TPA: RdgB/HAM1 family non-canonical purine NTP pyrophosphatase [Methylomirabilota bacterium]|nr:RdgB/HAM1 family non-canonical purine NTP pyrophosphatase [Methylomirabilota bacterium]